MKIFLKTFLALIAIQSASAHSTEVAFLCAQMLEAMQAPVKEDVVDRVRKGLDLKSGQGFAVVDTSELFPHQIYSDFSKAMPKGKSIYFHVDSGDPVLMVDNATKEQITGAKEIEKYIPPEFKNVVYHFAKLVEALINSALAPKGHKVSSIQLRTQSINLPDSNGESRDWHYETGFVNIISNILGSGTYSLADGKSESIPPAHTFIGAGRPGEKASSPKPLGEPEERLILILTLEPID